MAFARDVADQVIFMDGGVIVEQGDARQVIEHPQQERTRQFLSRYAENEERGADCGSAIRASFHLRWCFWKKIRIMGVRTSRGADTCADSGHGRVDTMGVPMVRYEAIGIQDGTILFLGSDREALSQFWDETTNLEGKQVLPGFSDTHMPCSTTRCFKKICPCLQ